jgi:hypothetical protein
MSQDEPLSIHQLFRELDTIKAMIEANAQTTQSNSSALAEVINTGIQGTHGRLDKISGRLNKVEARTAVHSWSIGAMGSALLFVLKSFLLGKA